MSTRTRKGILVLDFYCFLPNGKRVRCRESTGLRDNQENRKVIQAKDRAIRYELKHGRFEYLRFFPHGAKAPMFRPFTSGLTLGEWWPQWIEVKSLRPSSYRTWQSSFRSHIGPHFGHMGLGEIDQFAVMAFRKTLEDKGLVPVGINNRIIKPLCGCLLEAKRRGMISTYPCEGLKKLTESPADIDPFSFEELQAFLTFLEKRYPMYYDLVFIWSRTGLRPGEVRALRWKNVDYFNQKLLVRGTRDRGQEGPPKTTHSVRDVDLRPPVIVALKRQEARTLLIGEHVFLNERQRPWDGVNMLKKFTHLLRLAGLKYRPPKHLRHTFATLHLAAGENITWVSQMMGHSNAQMTWARYNRFLPNLTREDGSAFEKIMNGGGNGR
jgi:integrase